MGKLVGGLLFVLKFNTSCLFNMVITIVTIVVFLGLLPSSTSFIILVRVPASVSAVLNLVRIKYWLLLQRLLSPAAAADDNKEAGS